MRCHKQVNTFFFFPYTVCDPFFYGGGDGGNWYFRGKPGEVQVQLW